MSGQQDKRPDGESLDGGTAPTRGARPGAPEDAAEAYTSTPGSAGLGAGGPDREPRKIEETGPGPSQADRTRADRPVRTPEEVDATPPHGDKL